MTKQDTPHTTNKRRLQRLVPFVLALLLPIAFVSGAFVSSGKETKGDSPAEGSPEVAFARDMAVHHAQAVDMAERIRQRNVDQTVKILATDIVLTQQNQIGRFAGWLEQWGHSIAPPVKQAVDGEHEGMAGMEPGMSDMGSSMPGMASNTDVQSISTLPDDDAKRKFLTLMIAHHQGGVTMAQKALARTKRAEVRRSAESIIAAQKTEISAMRDMLSARTTGVSK
jgi:uncharacterized protein (DUF305 family)